MAEKRKYDFTMRDFLKYFLNNLIVLLICLALGGLLSAFSWKMQEVSYSLETTILVHDEEGAAGDIDEYEQLSAVLSSKGAYENARIENADEKIGNVEIVSGGGKGVLILSATGESEEAVREKTAFVIKNAKTVLGELYGKDRFSVYVLKDSDNLAVKGTKKDKIFSVAIIMMCAVITTLLIDFIGFKKRVECKK